MAVTTIDHKRGATFTPAGMLPEGALYADGTWTAKAEAVERNTRKRYTLTATLIPPVAPETRYTLHLFAPASMTKEWTAPGKMDCDVDFIDSAATPEPFSLPSKTFVINVLKDVTQ